MRKEKYLKGIKIKVNGKECKNISYFSIDSYDNKVHLSYQEKENMSVNLNCSLKDVDIEIEK